MSFCYLVLPYCSRTPIQAACSHIAAKHAVHPPEMLVWVTKLPQGFVCPLPPTSNSCKHGIMQATWTFCSDTQCSILRIFVAKCCVDALNHDTCDVMVQHLRLLHTTQPSWVCSHVHIYVTACGGVTCLMYSSWWVKSKHLSNCLALHHSQTAQCCAT